MPPGPHSRPMLPSGADGSVCPKCRSPMSPTLGGPPFCPRCGYQEVAQPESEEELYSNLTLYDASDFDLGGGLSSGDAARPVGTSRRPNDPAATNVMPAARPPPSAPRAARPGRRRGPDDEVRRRRRAPGESIFDTDMLLEPGSTDETPGVPLRVAPGGGAARVDQNRATADLPRVPVPQEESGARPVSDAAPLRGEALVLPRCKHCERPLELEEVAAGVCRECRDSRSRRRAGVTFPRAAQLTAGTLGLCEVLWIGALVLAAATRPDLKGQAVPGTSAWQTPEVLALGLRVGLVIFAGVAAVAFARGRDWGAGAAVALGPAAAALAALQIRSGVLEPGPRGLMPGAAWLGAGAVGALVTLVAPTCFGSGNVLSPASLLADKHRRRLTRRRKAREAGSPSPGKARAIVGGLVALAGAGVAGWQAVVALSSMGGGNVWLGTDTFLSVPQNVPLISGLVLVAASLAAAGLGVWLLVRPPAEDTHAGAVAAAAIAGALPAWLLLGAFYLGAKPAQPLAIVSGAVLLVGAESIAVIPCGQITPWGLALAAGGAGAALVCGLWVLFGSSPARGRALSGFAVAWASVWGSGLAMAAAST